MIFETILGIFAVVIGSIAFCLLLVLSAKLWYWAWYVITFILIYTHEKGNYNFSQHNELTKEKTTV
jgi:hypothetical protein